MKQLIKLKTMRLFTKLNSFWAGEFLKEYLTQVPLQKFLLKSLRKWFFVSANSLCSFFPTRYVEETALHQFCFRQNMQHKTDNNYEGLAGWPHREPFCIQVRHKNSRKRIMSTLFLLLCTYPMVIWHIFLSFVRV